MRNILFRFVVLGALLALPSPLHASFRPLFKAIHVVSTWGIGTYKSRVDPSLATSALFAAEQRPDLRDKLVSIVAAVPAIDPYFAYSHLMFQQIAAYGFTADHLEGMLLLCEKDPEKFLLLLRGLSLDHIERGTVISAAEGVGGIDFEKLRGEVQGDLPRFGGARRVVKASEELTE